MAQMFKDERGYPDNAVKKNFIFLAYPYTPPISLDDYRALTQEIQNEYPIRLWYFLDEFTSEELMRKVWRAILRSDLALFDISEGNPNVAFELGLALAEGKTCITLLKQGSTNPLGRADLGYSERAEYSSRETLKKKIIELLTAKSSGLKAIKDVSYHIQSERFTYSREEIEKKLRQTVLMVFKKKKATRAEVAKIFGDDALAGIVLDGLRHYGVFNLIGQRKAARWILGDEWIYHDHEVVGIA